MQYSTYQDIYLNGSGAQPQLDLLSDRMLMPEIFQSYLYLIEDRYNARPDLFSLDMYGTTEFAWLICRLNDIENPLEFGGGMKIWMPSADELWRFVRPSMFNDVIDEDETEDGYIDEVESVNDDNTTTSNKPKNNNKQYIKIDKSNGRIVF